LSGACLCRPENHGTRTTGQRGSCFRANLRTRKTEPNVGAHAPMVPGVWPDQPTRAEGNSGANMEPLCYVRWAEIPLLVIARVLRRKVC